MEAHSGYAAGLPARDGGGLPLRLSRARDERLARMVTDGSDRAFAALYDRHGQPLYRYCRSIVGNEADAQDVLQSTFASALVALRRGARDAPLRPWLFRIAHNEAISLLRRRRPTVELSDSVDLRAPSAAEQALERARLELLVRDLRELGDRQRGALVMRELSGLGHEEIALALDVTVGTAKQAIFEARQTLAEFAEGRAMPCEEIRRVVSDGDGRMLRGRRVRAHLRDCEGCSVFAASIRERRDGLQAIAPPLAPVALAGVFAHIAGVGGAGHGTAGAGALAAGGAGKSAVAALAAKALVAAALVTGTAVGVTEVATTGHHSHGVRHRAPGTPAGAAGSRSGSPSGQTGAGTAPATAHGSQPGLRRRHGAAAAHGGAFAHANAGGAVHGSRAQGRANTKAGAHKGAAHSRSTGAAKPKHAAPAGGKGGSGAHRVGVHRVPTGASPVQAGRKGAPPSEPAAPDVVREPPAKQGATK